MSRSIDPVLLLLWLVALAVGTVMVASASAPLAGAAAGLGPYVLRHTVYLGGGLVLFGACVALPLRWWRTMHRPLLLAAMTLSLLVLIPGVGAMANGARRWIALGPASIQAAEVGKLALVVYLAGYVAAHKEALTTRSTALLPPLAALGALAVLYLAEPDFGSVVVSVLLTGAVLFLAGVKLRHFALVTAVAVALLALLTVLQPYRMQRLVTFLDPWSVAYGSGYQLTQALIAFGRGDWFGLGLGEGIQKLFYLPEAHNDFIFAVIAEELGIVGAASVLVLLLAIAWRIFTIARVAHVEERTFAAFVAYGAGFVIALQTLISVGVNTGTLPTKGLTLPFISYGGNSLLMCCGLLGLAMRVDMERGRRER